MTTAVAQTPEIDPREAWLRERRKFINASEVGTILGINASYETPYTLWQKKTGRLPESSDSLPARVGLALESFIASEYERTTGRKLHNPGNHESLIHPKYPWLRCTRDRCAIMDNGEPGPVEMKNVFGGYFDDEGNWREPSNFSDTWKIGEAPLPYQWQLHTQMACMGASRGEIAALIGSTEFTVISYDFNPEAFEMVIPTLYEFWLCVKNDTPPEIDGSEATERALRKLHPFDNGETTELSDEIAYTINEWRELQNIESETKESIREKKNKIIAALERNTYGAVNGNRVVSFKMNKAGNRVLRKVGK